MLAAFAPSSSFGFDDPRLFALLEEGRMEVDQDRRRQLYEEANRLLVQLLPALPLVHVKPAVAFSSEVKGYRPSLVPWELDSLRMG